MKSLEEKLLAGVNAVFSDAALLSRHKLRPSVDQHEYARRVAVGFARGNKDMCSMNLIEAETGTGKTLGYAVPLVLYCLLTGERAAISTHTLALQREIFLRELPLALDLVHAHTHTGQRLNIARRFGLSNFVSYSRLLKAIERLDKKPTKDESVLLDALVGFAMSSSSKDLGPRKDDGELGEIAYFLGEYGLRDLPCGLKNEMICLSPDSPEAECRGYRRHVDLSKAADIVVTSHAMMVIHTKAFFALIDGGRPLSVLVCDEADRLPDQAESMLSQHIPIHYFSRLLESLFEKTSHPAFEKGHKASGALLKYLDRNRDKLTVKSPVVFVDDHGVDIHEEVDRFAAAISDVHGALRMVEVPNDAVLLGAMAEILVYCSRLKDYSRNKDCGSFIPMVSFSPSRKYPTLSLRPTNVGMFLSRLWAVQNLHGEDGDEFSLYLKACLMTSATLSDPAKRDLSNPEFNTFKSECGIMDSLPVYLRDGNGSFVIDTKGKRAKIGSRQAMLQCTDLYSSFSPEKFGALTFTLADPSLPRPIISGSFNDEEEFEASKLNPVWVDYVCNTIVYCHLKNRDKPENRMLVLCNAYRDIEAIMERLLALPDDIRPPLLLDQRRNTKIGGYKFQFENNSHAVMLTPAGWEGLNMPGKVNNLIIPRLPFMAPDSGKAAMISRGFLKSGKTVEEANRFVRARQQEMARKKLGQGLGRGIRAFKDECNVYICDPRFPVSSSSRYDGMRKSPGVKVYGDMRHSVPKRFLKALDSAEILMSDGSVFTPGIRAKKLV